MREYLRKYNILTLAVVMSKSEIRHKSKPGKDRKGRKCTLKSHLSEARRAKSATRHLNAFRSSLESV